MHSLLYTTCLLKKEKEKGGTKKKKKTSKTVIFKKKKKKIVSPCWINLDKIQTKCSSFKVYVFYMGFYLFSLFY
jgi:hypothetical protein